MCSASAARWRQTATINNTDVSLMIEKNERFPNGVEAVMLVVALFMVDYVLGAAFYDANGFLGLGFSEQASLITILGNGIIFTVLMQYKGLNYGQLLHSGSFSKAATVMVLSPLIVLTVPALILVISSIIAVVVQLFPVSAAEQAMFDEMGSGSLAAILMACVLAPVLEEMLFRGVILRSFLGQYGRWPAIIGSAVLFGAAHLNIYQFGAALILGLYLGWLYDRSKSLLPCIALHGFYNTALMTISFSGAGDDDFAAGLWLVAALLGVAGLVMLRRVLPQHVAPRL
jgi:membrane protease YdiL (CAAX protease family)